MRLPGCSGTPARTSAVRGTASVALAGPITARSASCCNNVLQDSWQCCGPTVERLHVSTSGTDAFGATALNIGNASGATAAPKFDACAVSEAPVDWPGCNVAGAAKHDATLRADMLEAAAPTIGEASGTAVPSFAPRGMLTASIDRLGSTGSGTAKDDPTLGAGMLEAAVPAISKASGTAVPSFAICGILEAPADGLVWLSFGTASFRADDIGAVMPTIGKSSGFAILPVAMRAMLATPAGWLGKFKIGKAKDEVICIVRTAGRFAVAWPPQGSVSPRAALPICSGGSASRVPDWVGYPPVLCKIRGAVWLC
mmetsp:Transcript_20042/g.53820  ORF Transcript_20042/g.53820 Transcript_20042/m.53820 type:complete len:312 (-) Transcript_20042:96-1031(-)